MQFNNIIKNFKQEGIIKRKILERLKPLFSVEFSMI